MQSIRKKKKYDLKLKKSLIKHQDFLVKRLQEEWEEGEKAVKKAELVRRAKVAASVAGKTLLVMAAIAGVLTVAVVAPNVISAFGNIFKRHRTFFDKNEFDKGFRYLRQKKYIAVKREGGRYTTKIVLTESGANVVLSRSLNELKIRPQDTWDKNWRLVLFDIPNRHKWSRDAFRHHLKRMGFVQLQKSVFITPYPCEEEISFLGSVLNISDYIRLIETERITGEEDLRGEFGFVE